LKKGGIGPFLVPWNGEDQCCAVLLLFLRELSIWVLILKNKFYKFFKCD
jgi:hypothetical protein